MLDLSFGQQLTLTLIDKAVIGGLLALAVFGFNRMLEGFKAIQSKQLEEFKSDQSRNLERIRAEQSRELEAFKDRLVSEGEFSRNVRLALSDVSRKLAAGNHAICWLCWAARYAPENVVKEDLDAYDREMHQILSELVGARAVLVALDTELHSQLTPLVLELYQLDVEVGMAKSKFASSPADALAALATLHPISQAYDENLIGAVAMVKKANLARHLSSVSVIPAT
jgi:hypothetical protein